MGHTIPWHVQSPGIYQSSSGHYPQRLPLLSRTYLKHLTWWSQPAAGPKSPVSESGIPGWNLSPSATASLFIVYSLHTMVLPLKQICRPGKLAWEYHHACDLYCHKHCCSVTSDVSPCRTLVPLVTTSITHTRPWRHEITCIHLSWQALLPSASSLQGRLQANPLLCPPHNPKQISCSFFLREWKLLRAACKFTARSNKGEFYTFPLLLLRLCNNVYWHVWMEHKLQFSSTACENGIFVKKQTSQFSVALTVGIRKDIDGKRERGDRPGGEH